MILLAALLAVAVVIWALVLAPSWVRRTRDAGGHWALAGIVYLSGPVNALIQLTYPNGQNPSGLGLVLARGNTTAAWTLAAVALLAALRSPRRGQTGVLTALLAFYASLLVSSAVGYAPAGVSEEYLITPLLVVPFVLYAGVNWTWLAGVLRRALRALVVLSLVSVPLLPSVAFDEETGRELFGIERIQGITGHPNTLAVLACFAVILELRGGRLPWLIPELAALLVAQSTTGWVALALGLLALAGGLGRSARVISIIVAAGSIVFAVADPRLLTDFFPPEFFTFTGRTTIWQAALHGFFLDPLFGYGPNLLDPQYRATYLGVFDAAGQAHNQIVQTLGETGLVGLACLVALLVAVLRKGVLANGPTGGLSLALVLAFAARLLSETPLKPQGSTATLLLVIAVLGIPAAGAAVAGLSEPEPIKLPPIPSREKESILVAPSFGVPGPIPVLNRPRRRR
ncbi:O-antigen ligase family protein [uncultured Amnibacterium sp.]|uniref:O-antigen ligase family protein n=1 Tax=uncultured Amnibacterium sp. TaxID=1631851 RepID=UPI0035CC8E08